MSSPFRGLEYTTGLAVGNLEDRGTSEVAAGPHVPGSGGSASASLSVLICQMEPRVPAPTA